MLVLLSFALVLVATVLLVLGLLNDDGLTLIYISIAASVAAAIVLVVGLRLNRNRSEKRPSAPAPLPDPVIEPSTAAAAVTRVDPEPEAVAVDAVDPVSAPDSEWLASDQDTWPDDTAWEEGEEVEFPIADYDTLKAEQILPLLPQLYADEIDVVDERERRTKARPEILDRLGELRSAPSASTDALASYTEPQSGRTGASAGGSLASASASSDEWTGEGEWFPIERYESLTTAKIRPLLGELDAEELVVVRDRELSLGARRTILDDIDRRLSALAPSAPVARRASKTPAPGAAKASRSTKTTKATPAKAAIAKKQARAAGPTKAAAKPSQAAKASKASTATKATKATKAAKATRATKAARATKAVKANTATKATRAAKATKASKATKATRAKKAN